MKCYSYLGILFGLLVAYLIQPNHQSGPTLSRWQHQGVDSCRPSGLAMWWYHEIRSEWGDISCPHSEQAFQWIASRVCPYLHTFAFKKLPQETISRLSLVLAFLNHCRDRGVLRGEQLANPNENQKGASTQSASHKSAYLSFADIHAHSLHLQKMRVRSAMTSHAPFTISAH